MSYFGQAAAALLKHCHMCVATFESGWTRRFSITQPATTAAMATMLIKLKTRNCMRSGLTDWQRQCSKHTSEFCTLSAQNNPTYDDYWLQFKLLLLRALVNGWLSLLVAVTWFDLHKLCLCWLLFWGFNFCPAMRRYRLVLHTSLHFIKSHIFFFSFGFHTLHSIHNCDWRKTQKNEL